MSNIEVRYPLPNSKLEYQEINGYPMSMKTQALVLNVNTTGNWIKDIKDALESAKGLKCGALIDSAQPNLYIKTISIQAMEGNKTSDGAAFMVDIESVPYRDIESNWQIEITSSQEPVSTSIDLDGVLFTSYTFPVDYPNPLYAGLTVDQGATLTRMQSKYSATLRGLKQIDDPLLWTANYLDRVNGTPFLGIGVSQWLCTATDYQLYAKTDEGDVYMFEFKFLQDINRHATEYCFIDPSTGKPPADLANYTISGVNPSAAIGTKPTRFYLPADFNEITR